MKTTELPGQSLTSPGLEALLANFLSKQAVDQAIVPVGAQDVVPHDAAPAQAVAPDTAWRHALTALRCYGLVSADDEKDRQPPSEWAKLVEENEPEVAIPCCVGNYPQQLRELQPLFQNRSLAAPKNRTARFAFAAALHAWADKTLQKADPIDLLIAAGVLRLATQFEQAAKFLAHLKFKTPTAWQAALANEQAAVNWQEGRREEAFAQWQALPASTPVSFNRGMAALFLGRTEEAKTHLQKAVADLPEDDSWHHLGCLYLALAELRA